jgi:hypothetical protein
MVSLTATLFKVVIHDSVLNSTTAEYIIDLAISEINLRSDVDLSLMSGTAGSKTVSLESKEYAAVMEAARAIYYGFYKGIENSSVGGIAVNSPDLKSNPNVDAQIERAARRLAELDVSYG